MINLIIRKLLALVFDWGLIIIAQSIVYIGTDIPLTYHFIMGIGFVFFSTSYFIWLSEKQTFGEKVLGISLVPLDEKARRRFKWRVFLRNLIYIVLIISIGLSFGNMVEFVVALVMFFVVQLYGPHRRYGIISILDFATKTRYVIEQPN